MTLAVVADLIHEAESELLLASYATVPGVDVRRAMDAAVNRGVTLTMLLERPEDNPNFTATANRSRAWLRGGLVWPAGGRPPGASMHAKLLVVDRRTALVGSATSLATPSSATSSAACSFAEGRYRDCLPSIFSQRGTCSRRRPPRHVLALSGGQVQEACDCIGSGPARYLRNGGDSLVRIQSAFNPHEDAKRWGTTPRVEKPSCR